MNVKSSQIDVRMVLRRLAEQGKAKRGSKKGIITRFGRTITIFIVVLMEQRKSNSTTVRRGALALKASFCFDLDLSASVCSVNHLDRSDKSIRRQTQASLGQSAPQPQSAAEVSEVEGNGCGVDNEQGRGGKGDGRPCQGEAAQTERPCEQDELTSGAV